MENSLRSTLLDIVKGCIATAALFIAYLELPVIGMLAGAVVPLPALLYDLKRGKWSGLAIVLVSALIFMLIAGPAGALLYVLQAGIFSLALPRFLTMGGGPARALASAVAVTVAVITVAAIGYGITRGVTVEGQVAESLQSSISQAIQLYEKSGVSGTDLDELREGMEQAAKSLAQLYPSLFVVGIAMAGGLNLLLLQRFERRVGLAVPGGSFGKYRNPDHLVWLPICAGFALLVSHDAVTTIALNVLVLTGFLYFIQGMAIIIHLFDRHAVPAFLRYLLYFLLFVQAYLVVAVALFGLLDLWGNFRRPRIPTNL